MKQIIEFLEKSRGYYDNSQVIHQFKHWVLQAELLVNFGQMSCETDKELIQKTYEVISKCIKDHMVRENCEILYTTSYLYLSMFKYGFQQYSEACSYIKKCI